MFVTKAVIAITLKIPQSVVSLLTPPGYRLPVRLLDSGRTSTTEGGAAWKESYSVSYLSVENV